MRLFDFLKKRNQSYTNSTKTQKCNRCKKQITGVPVTYTFAFHVAGSYCPPLCKKCATTMSFSVEYIMLCDNNVFNFALISDEMLDISVWLEKNNEGFTVTKEIHYRADDSITKQQKTIYEPRNISEVLWEIQHLCKEIKLDCETLIKNKELLSFVFSTDDPNVYVPRMMKTEFSSYALKSLSKVEKIKIGENYYTCSIAEQPLSIMINDANFLYSRIEGVHLPQGYNFIEHIKINDDEFYLYYVEHISKNDVLGWSIYTLSARMYEHMKFGGKNDVTISSLLGDAYISNPDRCIPYVVAAISNNMKILNQNGETWCE